MLKYLYINNLSYDSHRMHAAFNFIDLKMTRWPECAAIYLTRWNAGVSRGGLLRGTDSRHTPVRGSTPERGLLREKGVRSETGLPSTFIRVDDIKRFERTAPEQEVIRIFVLRANGNCVVRRYRKNIETEKKKERKREKLSQLFFIIHIYIIRRAILN